MIVHVLKNETFSESETLPSKGTERSTGYDIIATSDPIITGDGVGGYYGNNSYIEYKTNLRIAVQSESVVTGINSRVNFDYDVLAFPRSSIRKHNLLLANSIGLIDQDYRGEIVLCFKYIWQPEDYVIHENIENKSLDKSFSVKGKINLDKIYKKGDKICQLKMTKVENVEFKLVNTLEDTNRGEGGFGSTDKTSKIEEAKNHMSTIESLYNNVSDPTYVPKKYSELVRERELQ